MRRLLIPDNSKPTMTDDSLLDRCTVQHFQNLLLSCVHSLLLPSDAMQSFPDNYNGAKKLLSQLQSFVKVHGQPREQSTTIDIIPSFLLVQSPPMGPFAGESNGYTFIDYQSAKPVKTEADLSPFFLAWMHPNHSQAKANHRQFIAKFGHNAAIPTEEKIDRWHTSMAQEIGDPSQALVAITHPTGAIRHWYITPTANDADPIRGGTEEQAVHQISGQHTPFRALSVALYHHQASHADAYPCTILVPLGETKSFVTSSLVHFFGSDQAQILKYAFQKYTGLSLDQGAGHYVHLRIDIGADKQATVTLRDPKSTSLYDSNDLKVPIKQALSRFGVEWDSAIAFVGCGHQSLGGTTNCGRFTLLDMLTQALQGLDREQAAKFTIPYEDVYALENLHLAMASADAIDRSTLYHTAANIVHRLSKDRFDSEPSTSPITESGRSTKTINKSSGDLESSF
jgi:hypothetical protein